MKPSIHARFRYARCGDSPSTACLLPTNTPLLCHADCISGCSHIQHRLQLYRLTALRFNDPIKMHSTTMLWLSTTAVSAVNNSSSYSLHITRPGSTLMVLGPMYLVWLRRIVSYCILDLAFASIS
jgi:hypothetical protein